MVEIVLGVLALSVMLILSGGLFYVWSLLSRVEAGRVAALAQVELLRGELNRIGTLLSQYQEANASYRDSEEADVREMDRLRVEVDQLQRDGVVLKHHTVFLDGMPRAGKTTLIKRLTNPTATAEQLDKWDSTLDRYRTLPVPLCWEHAEAGQKILHVLEFYDLGGENPGHIGDNIDEYLRARPLDQEPAVALVIWDSEAELPSIGSDHARNIVYLNAGRLAAAYGTTKARQAIGSFVFFLNKSDVVEERLRREGRPDHVGPFFEAQQQLLLREVYSKALAMYPREPSIAIGSARTGHGVHDCLGAIVRQLGLERHVQGASSGLPQPLTKAMPRLVERRGLTAPVVRG